MRRNLLVVLLVMGVMTALERNSLCMIAPGRFGCPQKSPKQIEHDYGLFYHTGYAIAYVFNCMFLSIWMPFFDWWVKDVPVPKAALDGMNSVIMAVNRVLSVAHILYQGIYFLCILYALLRFKESTKPCSLRSDGPRMSWRERFFLVAFAIAGVVIGSGALHSLEVVEMARVKTLEYVLVIVPAQVLMGLKLASKVQWKRERRALAGRVTTRHVEMGGEDEKADFNEYILKKRVGGVDCLT